MKKILVVIGTRPNFIKVTRFRSIAEKYPGFDLKIVHTGQHYDGKMADVFFEQFGLTPDFFLNVPPGSPNSQVAEMMIRLEELFLKFNPDLIIVPGDVNSTLAGALTANKCGIRLAHLESGLRSFDRTMPEEFNRILADEMSDLFFVTEKSGTENLLAEGKSPEKIFFVGNTMIDTLVAYSREIEDSDILQQLSLREKEFVLMTMHRPATVDSEEGLSKLLELTSEITVKTDLVFPVHPRTIKNMESFGLLKNFKENKKIRLTEPLDYFAFQKLVRNSRMIITDSGGIQEESTFLGIPCLTIRPNTERPVTVSEGTNELINFDLEVIREKIRQIETGAFKKGTVPALWDGHATERIFEILKREL